MRGFLWQLTFLTSVTMGAAFAVAACGASSKGEAGGTGGMGGTGGSGGTAGAGGSAGMGGHGGTGDGSTMPGDSGASDAITAWCTDHATAGSDASATSGNDASAPLVFSIDLCQGPARQYEPPKDPTPVSPYIYGINAGAFVATSTRWGLIRQGGDDNSAYNWTNDYSNSGADFCYFQGVTTNGNLAGRYTDTKGDTIPAAQAKGEAFLATIPILDWVATAYGRNTGWDTATEMGNACPGPDPLCSTRSGSLRANIVDANQGDPNFGSTLAFAYANDGTSTTTGSPAFVANAMSKGSAFCSCAPGTMTCSGCTVATNPVAEDEFVNFLEVNYGKGGAPIFFDLDNEPNYWIGTHPELYPNDCSAGTVTWDDVVARDVSAATAIKKVAADATVFGPVVSGDGMVYGGDYSSPHFVAGTTEFSDWYLQQVAAASVSAKEPLIDVFDVHYYTVGSTDPECLEAPRLFWDPDATDISAAEANSLDFDYGDHSYWDEYWYPRQVIPRLFKKIGAAYSGESTPLPGLSFSEYNPGCETDISGGVAEADLLGIFGREGVFAATAWPLQGTTGNYLEAAYDLYRNYDGSGSVVGDTAVRSTSSDYRNTSVYAFTHSTAVTSVEIVAINKLGTAEPVTVRIASAPTFHTATLYNLVSGSPTVTPAAGSAPSLACTSGVCTLAFTLPATSATTIVLR